MRTIEEIKADIEECSCFGTQSKLDALWLEWFRCLFYSIEPDRLSEICQAEREQRAVVLPCKVGDTVYFLDDAHPTATIEEIKITNSKTEYCWVQYETDPETCELWDEGYFTDDDIGKTVFLTPEAARAALKGMTDEK